MPTSIPNLFPDTFADLHPNTSPEILEAFADEISDLDAGTHYGDNDAPSGYDGRYDADTNGEYFRAGVKVTDGQGNSQTFPSVASAFAERDEDFDGEVSLSGEARSFADLELARKSGFAPKPTVYRRGMPVISLGVANAHKSRDEFNARPDVDEGLAAFIEAIKAEERYERTLNLASLVMEPDGTISAPGYFHRERIEPTAFSQWFTTLCHEVGLKSGASFLASMSGEGKHGVALRAYNIETIREAFLDMQARELAAVEEANLLNPEVGAVFEPKQIMARARKNGIFAFVGPKYPCFDADQVAAAIARMHEREGMKIETNYDGAKVRFDIIAQTTIEPENFVAGEFFRVGYRISTSDDGKGAVKVSILLWQNLCLNLIVLDKGTVEIASIRHKGDITRLAAALDAALVKAQAQIGGFLDKWNYATKEKISAETVSAAPGHKLPGADKLSNEELMAGVFRSLCERKVIPIGARKAPEAVKALMLAWNEDTSAASLNGPTRASVVNAITRVAHDAAYNASLDMGMDEEDLWERAGGRVLDAKTPLLWIPSKEDIKAANAADKAARLAKTA